MRLQCSEKLFENFVKKIKSNKYVYKIAFFNMLAKTWALNKTKFFNFSKTFFLFI